jgi:SAM-dependent methyltransferase
VEGYGEAVSGTVRRRWTARDKAVTRRPVYSEFAPHYDELFGSVDEACLDFVQRVARLPATLLDAGCGTGRYARALAVLGYQVVALDRERDLLMATVDLPSPAHFLLADLRRLPFAVSFDVILARGVLNDFVQDDDLLGVLKSSAQILKGNGHFLADIRERESHRRRIAGQPVVERTVGPVTFRASRHMDDSHIIVSREQFSRGGTWSPPFEFRMRTFTEEEVYRLWQGAGLEVLSVQPSFGRTSHLADRLVVVAKRRR